MTDFFILLGKSLAVFVQVNGKAQNKVREATCDKRLQAARMLVTKMYKYEEET